jgi:hypothetical protein
MKRREFLLAATAASVGLSGCGGSGGASAAPDLPLVEGAWSITPAPVLRAGDPSLVIDLKPTLPPQVRRGGQFAVDPRGAALPAGVSLSPDGVLSLTSTANVGTTSGIVFSYTEPAA